MFFVYGFGPYNEFKGNISAVVIAHLAEAFRIRSRVFDSVFDRDMFERALDEFQPKYILGIGQSRRGRKLRIERYAQNLWAKRNAEPAPIDRAADSSRLEMRWELPLNDICEYGEDAGTYVCNFSMWVCEEWAAAHNARSAFIHIPVLLEIPPVVQYVESVLQSVSRELDEPR